MRSYNSPCRRLPWDTVRRLFAAAPRAVALGLTASAFSFNVEGGRCETCSGEGYETVEMQFLADVRLVCPVCRGRRFKDETLGVEVFGKSVSEVLDATVDDVLYRAVARRLGVRDVDPPGVCDAIIGLEALKRVTLVDQSPLGRTSRGNAAIVSKTSRLSLLGTPAEGSSRSSTRGSAASANAISINRRLP